MNKTSKAHCNIIFLLHLPPPIHGSSMVGNFIKESVSVNRAFSCTFINLLASKNIASTGKVSLDKLLGFVRIYVKVLVQLLRLKPQLCYFALTTTGGAFFKDVLLIFLLKLFKVRIVYHLHNKGISTHAHQLLYRLSYEFVFKDSDVIILSQNLYKDIETFVPFSKVHICPNGIPDNDSYNKVLDKHNGIFNILFLSNLIESKGVFVLLDACKILKDKGLFFKCTFIGSEGDLNKDIFEKRVDLLGLQDFVRYEGKKIGNEKIRYFHAASVFVFPTFYKNETFGLVNLEAMQNSLPVISTFEGGIPDIVEDGVSGFLVPQKNVLLLAEKIEFLINNPEIVKRMGEAGRRKYEKEFTLNIFENNMINILNQIYQNYLRTHPTSVRKL